MFSLREIHAVQKFVVVVSSMAWFSGFMRLQGRLSGIGTAAGIFFLGMNALAFGRHHCSDISYL